MAQQIRRRPQKTLAYESNGKDTEDLSRGMIYRELHLRLEGQLTVAALNNTAAKTKRGDEWAVVKRIDIIANNTDVVKSISGTALWWFNFFMYGVRPKVTAAIADGATADPAFDSTLILPFWMPRSTRPIDTALDARELSDLKAEVTWGTHTDINGDATGFTVEPTLEIHSLESFNVTGPFSQWRVYEIQKDISATNPNFQIQLPVGPLYRGFMLNFTDAGVDDVAILNNFKWKSGTTVFADIPGEVLRESNNIRMGLAREFAPSAYVADRRGSDNLRGAWYFYDHVTDGFLTEGIDSLGFSELELELDVTVGAGATKCFVYPLAIIPVRGVKNAA